MTRRKCIDCGGWFLTDGEEKFCPTDSRWTKRQQRQESLPPKRRGSTVGSSVAPGLSTRRPPAVETRHPSTPIGLDTPCRAHDYPSALNCPTCIRHGERDWEERVSI